MSEEETIKAFFDYLDDDDVKEQINAIKQISSVIDAVGVDTAKEKILPILEEKARETLEDEVLFNLCLELPTVYKSLGSNNLSCLIPIFYKLLSSEDTNIRETAVLTLNAIGLTLNDTQIETYILPLIATLSDSEWFPGKCAASGLFEFCYPKINEECRENLRIKCRELIQHESPIVRRTTAAYLEHFIKVIEKDFIKLEFVPVFDNLANDDQDSVKLLAINVGISIAKRLTSNEIEEFIIDKFMTLGNDFSWRVKYRFASEINKIQLALGPELTRKYLIKSFSALSKDYEAQIREQIAKNIVTFCEQLQKTYKTNETMTSPIDPLITSVFFEIIKELDEDCNENVVEELAISLSKMGKLLGREYSKGFLLPIFSSKISSESNKIKETIILNINEIIKIIGYKEVTEIIQILISDLKNASVWRTRRNLCVTLSYIIQHIESHDFNEHFIKIYEDLLMDNVTAVRRTSTLILPLLIKKFGSNWSQEHLVPILLLYLKKQYNHTINLFFSIDEILKPFLSLNTNTNYFCKDIKQLNEISLLNDILKQELDKDWVKESLKLCENEEYFNDDILIYAESVFDELENKNNIFEETNNDGYYLISILKLVLTTFLTLIKNLIEHKVENVRIRAINSLENIYKFSEKLNNYLQDENVENILKNTSEEESVNLINGLTNYIEKHKVKEVFIEKRQNTPVIRDEAEKIQTIEEAGINEILESCEEKLIFSVQEPDDVNIEENVAKNGDVEVMEIESVDV